MRLSCRDSALDNKSNLDAVAAPEKAQDAGHALTALGVPIDGKGRGARY